MCFCFFDQNCPCCTIGGTRSVHFWCTILGQPVPFRYSCVMRDTMCPVLIHAILACPILIQCVKFDTNHAILTIRHNGDTIL